MTTEEKPDAGPYPSKIENMVSFGIIVGIGFGMARLHDWYAIASLLIFAVATLFAARVAGGFSNISGQFGPSAYWLLFGILFFGSLSLVTDYQDLFGLMYINQAQTIVIRIVLASLAGLMAGKIAPTITSVIGSGDQSVNWIRFAILFIFIYWTLQSFFVDQFDSWIDNNLNWFEQYLASSKIEVYKTNFTIVMKIVSASIAGGLAGFIERRV